MTEMICYYCGATATSREHVPPKCLFLEKKDSLGVNMRRDLITVPSCDIHNSQKSHDDEFLMMSLAGIVGSNVVGELLRWKKTERALKRHKIDLVDSILSDVNEVEAHDTEGLTTTWGPPKLERLERCLSQIARGLYYHRHKEVYKEDIIIKLGFLKKLEGNALAEDQINARLFERDLADVPYEGANPLVFSYQLAKPDKENLSIFRLNFYGGLPVYGLFMPFGFKPPETLGNTLISAGAPVAMNIDDEIFWFNKPKEN